jgi:DNA-binding HxlR family transcriptional regulator
MMMRAIRRKSRRFASDIFDLLFNIIPHQQARNRMFGLRRLVQELNQEDTENVLACAILAPYPSFRHLSDDGGVVMPDSGYNQFCPVAMAAEILGTRWTLLLLRELVVGSTRFNELRRGVPRMSPALLSKRLKDLEAAGIVARSKTPSGPDFFEYQLTDAGKDLQKVVEAVGIWGQRWIETKASLDNLDPALLMWDIRRNIDPRPMPPRRTTIQIIFKDLAKSRQKWWLIVQPDREVDLCSIDPGFEVDLYLSTDLRTMTAIWMGYTTIARAKEQGKLFVSGNRQLEASMRSWFSLSRFAKVDKLVA